MKATISIFDKDVKTLLNLIDIECRKVDKCKYGLPPQCDKLEGIVYDWVYMQDKKLNSTQQTQGEICPSCNGVGSFNRAKAGYYPDKCLHCNGSGKLQPKSPVVGEE